MLNRRGSNSGKDIAVDDRSSLQTGVTEDTAFEIALQSAVKVGSLMMKVNDQVDENFFILKPGELLLCSKEARFGSGGSIIDSYEIDHMSRVQDITTNSSSSFRFLTSGKSLVLMDNDNSIIISWVNSIRNIIIQCSNAYMLKAALENIENDEYYEVNYLVQQKLIGIRFIRACEWAIVQSSDSEQTGVLPGSILTAINDEDVMLYSYARIIDKLKLWTPPLKLKFRKAPEKKGYLEKQARSMIRRSSFRKMWAPKLFILKGGYLSYKENDLEKTQIKSTYPLFGCSISLLSENDTGRPYCLQLESKGSYLVVSGNSSEDIMDWAIAIYHSIILANGGSFVVSRERERLMKLGVLQSGQAAIAATDDAERDAMWTAQMLRMTFDTQENGNNGNNENDNIDNDNSYDNNDIDDDNIIAPSTDFNFSSPGSDAHIHTHLHRPPQVPDFIGDNEDNHVPNGWMLTGGSSSDIEVSMTDDRTHQAVPFLSPSSPSSHFPQQQQQQQQHVWTTEDSPSTLTTSDMTIYTEETDSYIDFLNVMARTHNHNDTTT